MTNWKPAVGANFVGYGTMFRVWAPETKELMLVLETKDGGGFEVAMARGLDGYFEQTVSEARPGDLYWYRLDGRGPFPDPASRFQPRGVHGPSEIIDPSEFQWTTETKGIDLEDVAVYELHAGTFTPEGTFAGAAKKLPYLKDLGITAVELMPVADFAGGRNWGYDGVSLFAPSRAYGRPDDLRRFVDEAHRLGLAVFLDVVYNHLGPDGAYHGLFSRYYYSDVHHSPWGACINFDGAHSDAVRDFYVENALHWVHEYRVDGLRLDATHAIVDESPRHILAALASGIRESLTFTGRKVQVIAEDGRNLNYMLQPESEGGWALDGVWADDFHHQVRRHLAGDSDGYYEDFDGTVGAIAETASKGWFYCGQYAPHLGRERGTDPAGIDLRRFVFCIQNHDQIGNRALGDRLHHGIEPAAYRAASALLLLLPEVPLLFMGQEWAASSPFLYFTDHKAELGRQVTEGRRREFQKFAAFANPESIPDPQSAETFERSRLRWEEVSAEPHAAMLRLYRDLLRLRRGDLSRQDSFAIQAAGREALLLNRGDIVALICFGRGVRMEAPQASKLILSTEDAGYTTDPQPPRIREAVVFERPGTLIFRQEQTR